MAGSRSASPTPYRVALTCVLCLLAVIFAVEAKTAWYGPIVGLGSDVRAAKALPADMPRIVEHGVPVPDPIHPGLSFIALATLPTNWLAEMPARNATLRDPLPLARAAFFSPSIFFRPPPALS